MLEVKSLQKSFGPIRAVRDVSFRVEKGEVLGFLGPNGAGKTTTMRMITGFLPPDSGTAVVNGFDITDQPVQAKKQIGYLPENAPLYGDMTVFNYLRFIAEVRGFTGRSRDARVEQTVEMCRLSNVKHQGISTLSKGYRQRVCFAQALLHDPPVLIMDEPTDGLDPNQKHVVRTMIKEMAERKAMIISTHILEEVDAVCSRAIIISGGAIVANGKPAELRAQSPTDGAVQIAFASQSQEAAARLRELESAARVEVRDGRCLVYPRDRTRLFSDVMDLVRKSQWQVTELKVLDGRLDDVFRRLTTASQDGKAASDKN